MKKYIVASIALMSSIASFSAIAANTTPHEEKLDQIVAIVNDDVVTRSEFDHAVATIKTQLTQQNISVPPTDVLQKQVLTQLINNKLQIQVSKQAGMYASEQDVDNAIKTIAKQNNLSVEALYDNIHQEGMKTTDYRNEIRDQVSMQRLQQHEIAGKMTVTPQEITAYMKSHPLQMNTSKEYRLEDILVPLNDTPSTADIQKAKAHADDLVRQIKAGADFSKMAQAESGNKDALQGGDLGFRQLPEIPTAFAEIVVKMQPQTIAGPIQTPNGFHIIRLAEVRASTAKSQAPSRKQIQDFLLQQKFAEAVQNWVSKLRSQAFIVTNPTK